LRALTSLSSQSTLRRAEVAGFLLGVPAGSVLSVGGIGGASLRELIDQAEGTPSDRRALFTRLRPEARVEAYIEQAIELLAETARRLWPVWFSDEPFPACGSDALGRLAARLIARKAAEKIASLSPTWAEAAARLALAGRTPRVNGMLATVELQQLSLTISATGLVLVFDAGAAAANGLNHTTLVHALESIAQYSGAGVVALFPDLPPFKPPFDRILYGARYVVQGEEQALVKLDLECGETEPWLAPWRGKPHPLSEIEQRLKEMLDADNELAPLFRFNWIVETVRGSRPKVDLLWIEGRLAVEFDGYPDHTTRRAFISDRHRDYELTLSGFTVLRLANDEIAQDFGKAIEKIRDVVRLCRSRTALEG
jgi:very-short-patch-repair endonuclease